MKKESFWLQASPFVRRPHHANRRMAYYSGKYQREVIAIFMVLALVCWVMKSIS